MERYNSRLEGYEAITALEVIEHLDPHILSRFGVVTMGTYRPRILLVTTPVCLVPLVANHTERTVLTNPGRTSTLTPNSPVTMITISHTVALLTPPAGRNVSLGQLFCL